MSNPALGIDHPSQKRHLSESLKAPRKHHRPYTLLKRLRLAKPHLGILPTQQIDKFASSLRDAPFILNRMW